MTPVEVEKFGDVGFKDWPKSMNLEEGVKLCEQVRSARIKGAV